MRLPATILLLVTSASAQDVGLQVRPEVIYVENTGGNVVPMERMFFHVVVENRSKAGIEVQWVRFDIVNSTGLAFSGQYSGKALTGLFDSAIDRRRI